MLEGKYINEAFYEGVCEGRACVVKCSSKCRWSIGNEMRMAARMFAEAPLVVARPLACGEGVWSDGPLRGRAFSYVATAKVRGPSLSELLKRGVSDSEADSFAGDIMSLARALRRANVLHRDLFGDNLLLDDDGHLKAIDWQLAMDRTDPREDPWVLRNCKFRYVVFGVNRDLGLGVWNDFLALARLLAKFPQTEAVRAARAELAAGAGEMTYADPPRGQDRLRLWLYGWSLRAQMLLRGRRHRKYAQLERRWRTVRGEWKEEL
jgi:serine/threonine protein kinase